MGPNDDELARIAADDELLTALSAGEAPGGDAADDAAAVLLARIVSAVDETGPRDAPGGSGRRRHRRGGLWGLSLGISIAVAAGGGLSAAATDKLPDPVQRFVVEVGQVVPPASAEHAVAVPSVQSPPETGTAQSTGTAARAGRRAYPWGGAVPAAGMPYRPATGPDAAAVPSYHRDDLPTEGAWSGSTWTRYAWTYPVRPDPSWSPTPTPAPTSSPTPDPYPAHTTAPTPAPTDSPSPSASPAPSPQPTHGQGHPSAPPTSQQPHPHTGTPTPQSPQPTPAPSRGPRRGH